MSTSSTYRLRGEIEGRERTWRLPPGRPSLGSGPENDLILPASVVSRRHARFVIEPGDVEVHDVGSKNGTYVNGRRIERASLAPGDALRFGTVELRLECLHPRDARLALELSPPTAGRRPATPATTATRLGTHHERLRFTRRLLAHLRSGDRHGALALVGERLGADGALLADLGSGTGSGTGRKTPGVVSLWGSIDPDVASRLELRRDPAEAPVEERLDLGDGLIAFRLGEASTVLLLQRGAGRDGLEGEELPFLALELDALARRPGPEKTKPSPGTVEARFPDGWIHGPSAAMRRIEEQIAELGRGELPVLVIGETGVGKELVARALHLSSPRREAPFVAVNCAAIPEDLLEAELFGIGDRVATGVAGRQGLFTRAEGGSLFLDEIGEMPAALQAKLLRVLQEKELHPVGGAPRAIDVRILAATNAELFAAMERGKFRRDLYFRLAGFVLEIPPLRQRRDDLPILIERFLGRFAGELGKSVRGLTVGALGAFLRHPWPGNVRELEHELRRLVHVCPEGEAIEYDLLAPQLRASGDGNKTGDENGDGNDDGVDLVLELFAPDTFDLETLERRVIARALERCEGNQVETARLLGLSRSSLRRRLERYDLR